jgi:hypothetical protein
MPYRLPRCRQVRRLCGTRLLLLVLLVALSATLPAEPRHMLDYLLPRGGTRGTTVEVTFHGFSLENPREVLFYTPGIRANGFLPLAKPGDGFKAKFEIAADCPLGEHVLRVRTATALSDAVTFWVSPFPSVMETETKIGDNDTFAKAQAIPLNSTVEGQINPGNDLDRDIYSVNVQQGQRLSVEVEAARLGTLHFNGALDLAARIFDARGNEIGRNDDSALYVQDPVLSIVAPATGKYYVEIRQQLYERPQQGWYRAHIGSFSRPTAIFPAGGQAGSTIQARILGDPTGVRTEAIALPSAAQADGGNFDYYSQGAPSPNVLRVSPYPNVIWSGDATPAPFPAALNGIIDKPGEAQTFRFTARKGEPWRIRVYGRTLGAAIDPKIWIRAANDPKHLLDADDSRLQDLGFVSQRGTWHIKDQMDPVAVFKAPADGDYLIGIEDTTGAAGPDHVYRIEIGPLRDAVFTHITTSDGYQMPRLTGLIVPRGNRWTLDVQLAQGLGNTYKGDIDLEARGLPRGVTMIAPRYPKGANRMPVQFVAAEDAEPQAALIELLARPVASKVYLQTASRQAFALFNRPGELPWHYVFLDEYALAVTDPAPFRIDLEAPGIPLSQSGELQLKAKVTRVGDFQGPIEMQPDWLPQGVSKEAVVTIPAGKDEATFRIQANDKAAPGVYKIAMNASTTGGDSYSGVGRIRVSSAFVELTVAQPYLSIDLHRSAVERGKQAEITGALHQVRPFPGKASVKLLQMPKGVKMLEPAPQITADDTQVVFRIDADADALAGLYKGISCEVSFTEAGQTIRQHSGSGILRVDEQRGTPAAPTAAADKSGGPR